MGSADKPRIVQAAGIPDFSIKALNSFSAFPRITPCPQTTKGFLALFIMSAAFLRDLLSVVGTEE